MVTSVSGGVTAVQNKLRIFREAMIGNASAVGGASLGGRSPPR